MQPNAREEWMSIHFPHLDMSFGGVRASLAKAEVDTILLLMWFTEPFHNIGPDSTLHKHLA